MDIRQQLIAAIGQAAAKAVADGVFSAGQLPEIVLEVPPQKEFGDYATNFAMQSAKAAKKNPRVIAQAIIDRLSEPWLEKALLAGPGFINFYLKSDILYQELASILAAGENFGQTTTGQGERVQVEFVSANPTGPLHVGHGRGAAVGSALVNLLRAAGYKVEAEYYINDAGNQMDNLAASVNARYLELLGKKVEFPEDGYHGRDIIDTAQRIVDKYGAQYLSMPEPERLAEFKELGLKEKLAALKEDLEQFGVTFDVWFSERTLHNSGAVAATCELLQSNGNIYGKEGALWLKSTAYGDDKDRVVIRDNGVPTYLAADIAYHRDKFARGFDRVINIWGADHHGYICRVKAAINAMGYNADHLEVMILQMVSLYQGGQLVKMSKRTGQGVTLSELIEEVGRDAARFFFIMRSTDSQLDFDLDLAKSHSNENPVYYIQYAHARIASIFRQMADAGLPVPGAWDQVKLDILTEQAEIDLIKKMAKFPEEIASAARERAPHRIARYAHELAGMFHTFYNQCRIIGVDPTLQAARLALVTAVQTTIKKSLAILGVAAPDKM
ncbi:arginine--tRNA ligase [Sporomusa acidovorans]|uniref:Arginine--tRNA ligase n=1 Tax=Sporomusa acidovorans (strain ATCC 49682 / DSM 3132 / Mol) TaxID=1123286 RepID=A0ABZ3IWU1_SPOA4|nr:arginine--tRNA ligase [Sporomusa acidovorans]OZC23627.1 arginine--tRNA ligase [Sporomusa acidovorans DSM 3132]SDE22913.1 arginyl-tRNA synthetase [Sporomusa acidovorans]